MTANPDPRPRSQRRKDTEHRLAHDVDVWVATASASASASAGGDSDSDGDGVPFLVPLSFDWDGQALLLATLADSPTGRNLVASRNVRLGLGPTRDVTLIDGDVEVLPMDALPAEQGDRFAARAGFDPRAEPDAYRWFRVTPRRIQSWREANEIAGRTLLRDGRWLD
jgi:hypothetical protein